MGTTDLSRRRRKACVVLAAAAIAALSEMPRVLAAAGTLPDALRPFVRSDLWGLVGTALDGLGVPAPATIVLVVTIVGLIGTLVVAVVLRHVALVGMWCAIARGATE